MNDIRRPGEAVTPSASDQPKSPQPINSTQSIKDEELAEVADSLAETNDDLEAEDAVAAGVAAVGGIALKWHHLKRFFKNWWNNKKARYWTLAGLVALIATIFIVPYTRWGVLNAVGFRGSVSVYVVDNESNLPLRSAKVKIGGTEGQTSDEGWATLSHVKLGSQVLSITKPGYGEYLSAQNISFGSNDLGETRLVVTGTRFAFFLGDFFNSQPLEGVVAEAGEASALSTADGLVTLITEPTEEDVEVTFKLDGYHDKKASASPTSNERQDVKLVTYGWNAFVSKRDGKFDLFKSKLDGSDVEKVLAATGKERESSLVLLTNPRGTKAALVSTRDGERNKDGYVLSGLYVVDLVDNNSIRVDLAENIRLIGWADNQLIFTSTIAGKSGFSPDRVQIKRFLEGNLTSETLVSSNYFNDVMLADGRVYYAPAQSFKQSNPAEYFYSMLPDGSDQRTHISQLTGEIARVDFDNLVVETINEKQGYKQTWYEFSLSSKTETKLEGRPASFEYWNNSGEFVSNHDGSKTAWVDNRDGKQVIIVKNESGAEEVIWQGLGVTAPIRWVGDDVIVFRVVKDGSFDYAVSTNGGEAVKIREVTNVSGYISGGIF